jgi:predicted nucleotidyltransferase
MFRSIERRTSDEANRRASVPAALEARLGEFARRRGGRYLLFGSLARGEARHDSDVDLLLDFPDEFEADAWRLAEEACASLKIESDIKPLAWCSEAFRERALSEARIIA